MILNKHTDLIYDSKNFENYYNLYTVTIDDRQKEKFEYEIEKNKNNIEVNYNILIEQLNCIFILEKILDSQKFYKVIYGHFYNNENYFLYKNIRNDNLVEYKIKKCKRNELLFNKNHKLLCSHKYDDITTQLKYIKLDTKNEYYNIVDRPLEITYINYDDRLKINIKTDIIETLYNDECLKINIIK